MAGQPIQSRWIYGGIWNAKEKDERAIIYQREPDIDKFPVYAETVGQYTGLQDKNGTKIFEGDIVTFNCDEIGTIEWDEDEAKFVIIYKENDIANFDNFYGTDLEVIGNIYDNPELLEV